MKNYLHVLFIFACISASAQKWVKKTDLPATGRDAAISFAIDKKCYYGGGDGHKDFWEYNPDSNKWTKKANIPGVTGSRSFGVGFAIGGRGYVGLGADGGTTKKDFWEYNPGADKWTQKADFPAGRDGLGSFVIGTKGYVVGGTDDYNFFDGFYSYDASTDKWDSLGQIPTGSITFPMGFSIGNRGFITGGGVAFTSYSSTYEYNPSNNSWTQKADLPGTPRQAGIGFSINGKGYVGLGQSGYTTVYKDIYEYDSTADAWAQSTDFSASGVAWPTATVLGGIAYVGGGWDLNSTFSKSWYAFVADTFTAVNHVNQKLNNGKSWYNSTEKAIFIKLENAGQASGQEKLFDITGKLILSQPISIQSEKTLRIDCPGLGNGMYILTIAGGNTLYSNKLFIID